MMGSKIILKMPTEKLTAREIEVLTFSAYGKTRGDIALILSLSEETIKAFIGNARRKLGAANKTNAIVIALTLGWITPYQYHGPAK